MYHEFHSILYQISINCIFLKQVKTKFPSFFWSSYVIIHLTHDITFLETRDDKPSFTACTALEVLNMNSILGLANNLAQNPTLLKHIIELSLSSNGEFLQLSL
jgi:hypothetical protein